jgi:hypothetical protein
VRDDPEAARNRASRASERLAAIEWRRQREDYLTLIDELVGSRANGEVAVVP